MAVVVMCMTGVSLAQQVDAPTPVRDLGDKPDATARPDDEVGRILTERPAVPVTTANEPARRPKVVLEPEGLAISNRRCMLLAEKGNGWLQVKFLDEGTKGGSIRRALPSAYLEQMEKVALANPQTIFIISGETFAYNNLNYILLQKVLVEPAAASQPASQPAPASQPVAAGPAATSAPASNPSRPAVAGRSRAANRAQAMVQETLGAPRKPLLLDVDQPKPQDIPSVAPITMLELPSGQTTSIADRVVRVVPEEGTGWYLACFDSDNTLQEPPYRLLPCKLLEEASKVEDVNPARPTPNDMAPNVARIPHFKAKNVSIPATGRCRISGEVLQYKGRKYLLLRRHMPEHDMGQF